MKIVMLCRLFSPHRGGVERHAEEIAKQAVLDGHSIKIVTSQHGRELAYWGRFLIPEKGICTQNLKIREIDRFLIYRISTLYEHAPQTFMNKLRERLHVWLWMLIHFKLFFDADIIHIHDVFW